MPTSVIITLIICITLIILVLITGNREKASVEETVNDLCKDVHATIVGIGPAIGEIDRLIKDMKTTKMLIAQICLGLDNAGIELPNAKIHAVMVGDDDEEECGDPDKCCDEPSDAKPVKKPAKKTKTDKCETEDMDCPSK